MWGFKGKIRHLELSSEGCLVTSVSLSLPTLEDFGLTLVSHVLGQWKLPNCFSREPNVGRDKGVCPRDDLGIHDDLSTAGRRERAGQIKMPHCAESPVQITGFGLSNPQLWGSVVVPQRTQATNTVPVSSCRRRPPKCRHIC